VLESLQQTGVYFLMNEASLLVPLVQLFGCSCNQSKRRRPILESQGCPKHVTVRGRIAEIAHGRYFYQRFYMHRELAEWWGSRCGCNICSRFYHSFLCPRILFRRMLPGFSTSHRHHVGLMWRRSRHLPHSFYHSSPLSLGNIRVSSIELKKVH
jgi:hypothetical protein